MWRTITVAVLAVTAMAGGARAAQVDQRRPAASDGLVEIENPAGSVRVIGWSKAEVAVTGNVGRRASLRLTGGGPRTHGGGEGEGNPNLTPPGNEGPGPPGSRVSAAIFPPSSAVV